MKSTVKGNTYEKEVKDTLERHGWIVFRQHRKPMFISGKMITVGADIFGCDLVAKKLGEKTRWIQVSTVENKSKKEQQLMMFPWNRNYESAELWLRIKGKKQYRVFKLIRTPEDLRHNLDTPYEFKEEALEAVNG